MAMSLPCITSSLANSALGAEENVSILIGHTPEEYARHILYLLENKDKAAQIALKGREYVKKSFIWEVSTSKLESIILNSK